MKITLNTYDIVNHLLRNTNSEWSRSGAYALAEYLEEMEKDTGEEMELDVVAIRCYFSEYSSAVEAAGEYGWSADETEFDDSNEAAALAWLNGRTSVITFNGGVIIAKF